MNGIMKRLMIPAGILASTLITLSCATGAAAKGGFADVMNKDWVLAEVRINSVVTTVDRSGDRAGDFTLHFDAERVTGTGAPNRYFSPYTAGEGSALSIGTIAGTLMAPLFEPEGLKENEYFAYLGNVTSWSTRDGKLELSSSAANGDAAVLVFQPK